MDQQDVAEIVTRTNCNLVACMKLNAAWLARNWRIAGSGFWHGVAAEQEVMMADALSRDLGGV